MVIIMMIMDQSVMSLDIVHGDQFLKAMVLRNFSMNDEHL